ncbi:MAG: SPFH/Band 7/PHB domain protein [Gammaproteobacteria bacterium]|nr:MAG: SPFH/Band 7/PHB domain protein [Gammaproteobacteria bacterium]
MPLDVATLLIIVAVVLLLGSLLAVRRVPQGFAFTVERFGRYVRTLEPGLCLVWPIAERIGARQDLRERHLRLALTDLVTRDRINVRSDAVCFYQIADAAKASYEVESLEDALRSLLGVMLRNQVGNLDLDALLGARARLGVELMNACEGVVSVWGVQLTRVELDTLQLPEALMDAVAKGRTTELERRASVLAAEGERRTARLKAEADRDASIMHAETGSRVAALEAEARERRAEAEARASLMLSRAVAEERPQTLSYLIARQYVDALQTLAASDNGRFVVMPLEHGGLSSSFDGIRALAEGAFADARAAGASGPAGAENTRDSAAASPSPASVRSFQPPDVDGRIG